MATQQLVDDLAAEARPDDPEFYLRGSVLYVCEAPQGGARLLV
jgi:hypothetical protein